MPNEEIKKIIQAMQNIAIDGILYSHSYNTIKQLQESDSINHETTNFLKKSFADNAVISWTKIFGSDGQEKTHWKILYGHPDSIIEDSSKIIINDIPSNYNCYTADKFRNRVFNQNNLTKIEGETDFFESSIELWNNIKTYRDNYLAHSNPIEIEQGNIVFPHIFPIYKTLIEFSNILTEIDNKARLSLFPDNAMQQNYTIQRDNLKNRIARNIQNLLESS